MHPVLLLDGRDGRGEENYYYFKDLTVELRTKKTE